MSLTRAQDSPSTSPVPAHSPSAQQQQLEQEQRLRIPQQPPPPPLHRSSSFAAALRDLEPLDPDVLDLANTLRASREGFWERERPSGRDRERERYRGGSGNRNGSGNTSTTISREQYGGGAPARNALYDWSPITTNMPMPMPTQMPSDAAAALRSLHSLRATRARERREGMREGRRRDDAAGTPTVFALAEAARATAAPTATEPVVVPQQLEDAVKYLSSIRDGDATPQAPASDYITDAASLPALAPSSWLAPGAVLVGVQHATTPPDAQPSETWPVRVTIHAVDWSALTLAATMEAYDLPAAHAATTRPNTSITTFLEAELLDFRTHTLATESFNAEPAIDALYWHKLPPFAHFSDTEWARVLRSRTYLSEVLAKNWILMRWKERCFVKSLDSWSPPSPTGSPASHTLTQPPARPPDDAENLHTSCGLTISGFYYVCLNRKNGRVEGMYHDPLSSPYQCLRLESQGRARFPAWGFR